MCPLKSCQRKPTCLPRVFNIAVRQGGSPRAKRTTAECPRRGAAAADYVPGSLGEAHARFRSDAFRRLRGGREPECGPGAWHARAACVGVCVVLGVRFPLSERVLCWASCCRCQAVRRPPPAARALFSYSLPCGWTGPSPIT